MRILVTSDTFLPLIGGGEMHVKEICSKMVEFGHQVTLITTQAGAEKESLPFKVIRIPWQKSRFFFLLLNLVKEARMADIVESHYSYRLATLAAIAAKVCRKPIVLTLHGLGTLDEAGAKFPYKQAHALYRFISLNLATYIISTSEDIAIVARDHMFNREKITIIFNGLDTSLFNSNISIPRELKNKYEGKKVILTVRRLVPKNGIHFLVDAMPEILRRVPEAHYIMIGYGRMESYIRERIKILGLEQNIDMIGAVENIKVPAYLKLADAVIFPSTAESSSIACAEALAMGKTVVSSSVGGLLELIGRGEERGILVKLVEWEGSDYDAPLTLPSDRYVALAEAVEKALKEDQGVRQKEAIKFAQEELDWNVVTQKTLDVYNRIIT